MIRPPISHLFDSTIRIWRPLIVTDTVGVEQRSFTSIADVGAAINRSRTAEQELMAGLSPGLVPRGGLRWYGLPSLDVQPRDLCQIIAGPDAGTIWEVNADPVRLRGHHTQVDCLEWSGMLPEVES